MIFKQERGSALILVLIVIFVMTALGGAFAFYANTEGKQSIHRYERDQAYYYARSGIEAGYEYLLQQLNDDGELGDFEGAELYNDLDLDFLKLNENGGTDGTEKVHVEISVNDNDEREIIIASTGRYGSAEEDITRLLSKPDAEFPPDPDDVEAEDAEELEWTNPEGNIKGTEGTDEDWETHEGNVLFPEGNASEIQPNQFSSFKADKLYYLDTLYVKGKNSGTTLEFYASLTVFYDEVMFDVNNQDEAKGRLCFGKINGDDHIIHFKEKVYKDGEELKDKNDDSFKGETYKIKEDYDKACLPDQKDRLKKTSYQPVPSLEDWNEYWE